MTIVWALRGGVFGWLQRRPYPYTRLYLMLHSPGSLFAPRALPTATRLSPIRPSVGGAGFACALPRFSDMLGRVVLQCGGRIGAALTVGNRGNVEVPSISCNGKWSPIGSFTYEKGRRTSAGAHEMREFTLTFQQKPRLRILPLPLLRDTSLAGRSRPEHAACPRRLTGPAQSAVPWPLEKAQRRAMDAQVTAAAAPAEVASGLPQSSCSRTVASRAARLDRAATTRRCRHSSS